MIKIFNYCSIRREALPTGKVVFNDVVRIERGMQLQLRCTGVNKKTFVYVTVQR